MKSIAELTLLGKLRRQNAFAQRILGCYPIRVVRLRLLSYDTNFIYRVTDSARKTYILRLAFPGWRSAEDADLESAWLEALAKDTDLTLPNLYEADDGRKVVRLEGRHAVLMTDLPGMLLGRRLTPVNLFKMGELFARLHLHAGSWSPPAGLANNVFSDYLSRGEPKVLFEDSSLSKYTQADLKIIRDMSRQVSAAYAGLDPADRRVIHCDLWHDNIKLYRGELAPFDFEDAILGYRLHDIAMALLDLAEDTDTGQYYNELFPAFRAGYERLLPWPEGSLETLQMGRVLWRLNWIARHSPDHFGDASRFYADLFRRFIDTGRLVDPLRG